METYTAAEEAGLLRLKPRVRVTTTPTEGERERTHRQVKFTRSG